MMKLMFLGSGSAFTVGADNFQSNMLLINEEGKKLLIDCGTDIRFSLNFVGFSYLDLTDIYISHLHADHTGGLEYVGFSTKFDPRCSKPNLYLSEELASELWDTTLSGGMKSIDGEIANLETYFHVNKVFKNDYFIWENIKIYTLPMTHIIDKYSPVYSYGILFQINETKIFITTDTKFCSYQSQKEKAYHEADIIFHDCETTPFQSGVHSHYKELLTLPEHIRNKMWLYHYQPGTLPDAKKDGFLGFVKRGQIFEFDDVKTLTTNLNL